MLRFLGETHRAVICLGVEQLDDVGFNCVQKTAQSVSLADLAFSCKDVFKQNTYVETWNNMANKFKEFC